MAERLSDAHSLIAAAGDLIVGSGPEHDQRLPVGTDGQVLTADSGAAAGIAWADPTGGGGGSSLEYVAVTVTSADITTMHTTGVPLTTLTPGDWIVAADVNVTSNWTQQVGPGRIWISEIDDRLAEGDALAEAGNGVYINSWGSNESLSASGLLDGDSTSPTRWVCLATYHAVIRAWDHVTSQVVAGSAASLPLTVVTGVNDQFRIDTATKTVAAGVYTTTAGLATAMATAATAGGTYGGGVFSGSDVGGKVALTTSSEIPYILGAGAGVSPHDISAPAGFTTPQDSVLGSAPLAGSGTAVAQMLIHRAT